MKVCAPTGEQEIKLAGDRLLMDNDPEKGLVASVTNPDGIVAQVICRFTGQEAASFDLLPVLPSSSPD